MAQAIRIGIAPIPYHTITVEASPVEGESLEVTVKRTKELLDAAYEEFFEELLGSHRLAKHMEKKGNEVRVSRSPTGSLIVEAI